MGSPVDSTSLQTKKGRTERSRDRRKYTEDKRVGGNFFLDHTFRIFFLVVETSEWSLRWWRISDSFESDQDTGESQKGRRSPLLRWMKNPKNTFRFLYLVHLELCQPNIVHE